MRRRRKPDTKRIKILSVIVAAVMVLFAVRLGDYQLVFANRYSTDASSLRTRKVVIKAARGEIVDRYGRSVATNRSGYDIVFNRAYMTAESMNATILSLIDLMEQANLTWNDALPLTAKAPYDFTDDESAVSALKSALKVNTYSSASDCFKQLVETYSLQSYDTATQRKLMGVRYSMTRADFSVANPYTFAGDVSAELMSLVSERHFSSRGVEINVVPYREYSDDIALHIVGTVGKMDAEDWKIYKDKGYSYNDYVGKSGLEKEYESYLRGIDGEMTYVLDAKGNTISSEVTKEPVQGNTLVMTVDKRLQQLAQQIMVDNFEYCLKTYDLSISSGAMVVMDVRSAEVLAAVNCPYYTTEEYKYHYSDLLSDPQKPLFNRAFDGTYAPGSIVKMAMTAASLEKKVTSREEIIDCVQTYTQYKDYQPNCLHHHGPLNIVQAIGYSCNYFFFSMADRLSIADMNSYFKQFGLGVKTGVELPESAGVLAGPEYSAGIGEVWSAGSKLQAAIGQQNNAFTPLQLCNYCATIANGGTRYRAKLVKEVYSATTGETLVSDEPEVLNKVTMSANTLKTIREGMRMVCTEGTAGPYFANYPLEVAGKTGTAQTSGDDNTLFLAFAPYDDPEIAACIVVENGKSSVATVPAVKDVLTSYFYRANDPAEVMPKNTVLP